MRRILPKRLHVMRYRQQVQSFIFEYIRTSLGYSSAIPLTNIAMYVQDHKTVGANSLLQVHAVKLCTQVL